LKFALLLELSHRVDLTIGVDAVKQAIGLTDFLKGALRNLFAQEFAFTQPMKDRQKILRLVTARPGIVRRDLLRASSLLARPFEDVIRTLVQEETILQQDGGFYPVTDPSVVSAPGSSRSTDTIHSINTGGK
jgi:hypothetical protein